jgi:hypothetical protein
MAKMMRIQLEITKGLRARIDELMKDCGLKTEQEMFDTVMTLFQWAVNKSREGYVFFGSAKSDVPEYYPAPSYYGLDQPALAAVKKSHAAPSSSGTFGRATYSERSLKYDGTSLSGTFLRGRRRDKPLPGANVEKEERASEVITVAVTEREASALAGMMKACGLKTRADLFDAAWPFLWAAVDARKRGGWLVAASRKKCFMVEMPALASVSYIPGYPEID